MNERIKEIIEVPFSSQLCINCKKGSWGGLSYIPRYFRRNVSLKRVVHDGFSWFNSVQGDAYWSLYSERQVIPTLQFWNMNRDDLD